MGPGVLAVFVALGASLVLATITLTLALPIGRRLGFVVRPRLFGKSERPITHLGGPAIAVAAIAVFLLFAGGGRQQVVVIAGGVALMILGFIDDRLSKTNGINPLLRLLVEMIVSFGAWLGGVRIMDGSPAWLSAILTVIYLVGAANALNLVDNMDGIGGITAAAAAFGIGTVALYSGQLVWAVFAASLFGACLAFLPFNLLKARMYLGDAGSLFLGFSLGAGALMLESGLSPIGNFLLPIVVLAVPFTDTAARQIARWVAGGSVFDIKGGTDHMSHRLVRMGLRSHEAAFCHCALGLVAAAAASWAVIYVALTPLMFALGLFAVIGLMFALSAQRVQGPAPLTQIAEASQLEKATRS